MGSSSQNMLQSNAPTTKTGYRMSFFWVIGFILLRWLVMNQQSRLFITLVALTKLEDPDRYILALMTFWKVRIQLFSHHILVIRMADSSF